MKRFISNIKVNWLGMHGRRHIVREQRILAILKMLGE